MSDRGKAERLYYLNATIAYGRILLLLLSLLLSLYGTDLDRQNQIPIPTLFFPGICGDTTHFLNLSLNMSESNTMVSLVPFSVRIFNFTRNGRQGVAHVG